MENRKINAETNSHGNKLSTRTNAFHQLFHQRQQPTLSTTSKQLKLCHLTSPWIEKQYKTETVYHPAVKAEHE